MLWHYYQVDAGAVSYAIGLPICCALTSTDAAYDGTCTPVCARVSTVGCLVLMQGIQVRYVPSNLLCSAL